MKGVIYSAVFGMRAHFPTLTLDGWDKVILTDNARHVIADKCWTVKIVEKQHPQNRKSNRYYKWLSHHMFKEYEYVMYFDSKVRLHSDLNNVVSSLIKQMQSEQKLGLFFKHPERRCAYDECQVVAERKLDTIQNVKYIQDVLKKDTFPRNLGLTENNIFIRYNRNMYFNSVFEKIYDIVHNHICRDQLVFMYHLWKNDKINKILMLPHHSKATISSNVKHVNL